MSSLMLAFFILIVATCVFYFAILVLRIGVMSFPLLLDRDVGAAVALLTSIPRSSTTQ